jgi:hypothetical protein
VYALTLCLHPFYGIIFRHAIHYYVLYVPVCLLKHAPHGALNKQFSIVRNCNDGYVWQAVQLNYGYAHWFVEYALARLKYW